MTTIAYMAKEKKQPPLAVARLTQDEIDELDRAANAQTVPVARAALVAEIIRQWLRQWRSKGKPKP